MAGIKDLINERIKEIKAIKVKEAKKWVGMPASVLIQEAEDLYVRAKEDREELRKAGMDRDYVEELDIRARICRYLTSEWHSIKGGQTEAEMQFKECLKESREVHKEIRVSFRYAFRRNKKLLKTVKQFSGYRPVRSLFKDLVTMASLCEKESALLSSIKFPKKLIDKANSLSERLRELSSRRMVSKVHKNRDYMLYKKGCLYLKQCMKKIRACGRYVFADNSRRLRGYRSHYRYVHRSRVKKEKKTN